MRGHVGRKAKEDGTPLGTWFYVIDMGTCQAQRCEACGKRVWPKRRPLPACPKCGGELHATEERRQVSHSGYRIKKDAQAALNKALGDFQEGRYVPLQRMRLSEFMRDHYVPSLETRLATGSLKASTKATHVTMVDRYITPRIGGINLHELTTIRVKDFYRALLADGRVGGDGGALHPNSVRRIHTVLHRALGMAVEDGLLYRNVADGACRDLGDGQQDKDGTVELQAWTREELATFLASQRGDRLYPLWYVIAFSGLRRGEALGLEWSAVDLNAGELLIRRSLVPSGGKVVVSTPKTERSRRIAYIDGVPTDESAAPTGTVAVLREHAARQGDECRKAGEGWTETGLVFTREDGKALGPRWVSRLFERAIAAYNKARLEKDGPAANGLLPVISLHGLRHTYASVALSGGMRLEDVSEQLGHASITITMDIYGHLSKESRQRTAAQFAAIMAPDPEV
jgi:integrase